MSFKHCVFLNITPLGSKENQRQLIATSGLILVRFDERQTKAKLYIYLHGVGLESIITQRLTVRLLLRVKLFNWQKTMVEFFDLSTKN